VRAACSGYKFETICTEPDQGADPNQAAPVDATSEYCAVVKTKIDDISLIIAAEVDLVDPQVGWRLVSCQLVVVAAFDPFVG
jgi:hypothetical protein